MAHQLQALMPAPTQIDASTLGLWEHHAHWELGPPRPVGCMRGLGAKPLQLLGKAVDLCGLIVQIQRHPGECFSTATPK